MPKPATKVAVSIPTDLYRALERRRRARGTSRSAAIQEAVRYWLEHEAQRSMVREYEAGYRSKPERQREVDAAEAAAVRLFATEDW